MSRGKKRDLNKERWWRQTIQQWCKSGVSARAFCRRQGLSEPSFYAWRRTLAKRDANAGRLVPVRVIREADGAGDGEASMEADAGAALAGLELVVAGGQRLRIGPGFDRATLVRLLAILQEGRPCC